jgi:hypothetical protein
MPNKDLIIIGNYQEVQNDMIYYGSFVVPRSAYTEENISKYVTENDIDTDYYSSVLVSECIDKENPIVVVYPAYPPFENLSPREVGMARVNYYEPLTLLLPESILEKYDINLEDATMGIPCWGDMKTDNVVISIKDKKYKVFVMANDGTLPKNEKQIIEYTIKLTRK